MNILTRYVIIVLSVLIAFNVQRALSQTTQYENQSTNEEKKEESIEKLEKKYWVAKDTQFQVVQNRQFSKEKRFSVSGLLGPMINDQFSDATALNVSAGYYFTERWGVEMSYLSMNPEGNSMTTEFVDRFGVVPNHNIFRNYIGVSGGWVPIYAKASLQNSLIMYFDFAINLGLGLLTYEQQFTDKENESKTVPALALDLSQQVFLSKNFALRVSYFARWFNEETRDSRTPHAIQSEGFSQTNIIMMGMTYFH